jgi:hypothetical protein
VHRHHHHHLRGASLASSESMFVLYDLCPCLMELKPEIALNQGLLTWKKHRNKHLLPNSRGCTLSSSSSCPWCRSRFESSGSVLEEAASYDSGAGAAAQCALLMGAAAREASRLTQPAGGRAGSSARPAAGPEIMQRTPDLDLVFTIPPDLDRDC